MGALFACTPVLLMLGGALAMALWVRRVPSEQRGAAGKSMIVLFSRGSGVLLMAWFALGIALKLVPPGFGLTLALIGLALMFQGWIFNRIY